jgi:hypothetical protein
MRPETLSAYATGFAILAGLCIGFFNLGRLDMAASARQCKPAQMTFTIPFKGTLP